MLVLKRVRWLAIPLLALAAVLAGAAHAGTSGTYSPLGGASSSGSGGSTGGGTLYVDGVATGATTVAGLSSASYTEGQQVYVASIKNTFTLTASALAASSYVRVAALGKSGFLWIRTPTGSPGYWDSGAKCIAATTGDDDNTGTSPSCLKTSAELNRRLAGRGLPGTETASFTVNVTEDLPDTDWAQFHVDSNTRGSLVSVTIACSTTAIAVGTLDSVVAKSAATNTPNQVTKSGFNWGTDCSGSCVGKILRHVSTPTTTAVITKDLGGGSARLAEQSVNGTVGAGFTAGQNVEIQVGKKVAGVTASFSTMNLNVTDCQLAPASGGTVIRTEGFNSSIIGRRLEIRATSMTSVAQLFTCAGCAITTTTYVPVGTFSPSMTEFINTAITLPNAQYRHHWASCGLQGTSTINVGDHATIRLNGDFHAFDLPTGTAGIQLTAGGIAYFAANYYGAGNHASSAGILAQFAGWVYYVSGTPPVMDAGLGLYYDGALPSSGSSLAWTALPLALTAKANLMTTL